MLEILGSIISHIFCFALHFENGASFPKPLNAKEEAEAFRKFEEEGDENAKSLLIEHNLRLVAHIIKKYYSNDSDQDDLISIGTIGLIKAVSSFSYKRGTRFATYASKCIENEILMYFRSQKKNSQDIFISDPLDTDSEGNVLTLSDIIYEESDIIDNIDTALKVSKLKKLIVNLLSSKEKEIIILRYGLQNQEQLTQREIAKKLGISRSYVSRIEKKALQKLKAGFDKISNS